MEINRAVRILELHNKWRRYNGPIESGPQITDVKELGEAIDTVVLYHRESENNKEY